MRRGDRSDESARARPTASASRRELLAVQLRLIEGVDLKNFQARHGELGAETWLVLEELGRQGLLLLEEPLAKLTLQGRLFYDTVASEIV